MQYACELNFEAALDRYGGRSAHCHVSPSTALLRLTLLM